MHSYHSLGRVLRDAGFRFPPLIESIPEGGRMDVSAERLPELDADFVFATWRGDTGAKPQDELAAMEKSCRMVSVSDGLSFRALCADFS